MGAAKAPARQPDQTYWGLPVGVAPPAPTGSFLPTVLAAIMGPYPMDIGGQTTLDTTLAACKSVGAVAVFIPDLIAEEAKANPVTGSRLEGHTAMRNEGIRLAEEGGYDYLLLVENDVELRPSTLFRLLRHGADVMLPRLTYPEFDPVEWICYGPQAKAHGGGILDLTWAAHCCILFKVAAIKAIVHPVFQGFQEEGKDHEYWQKQSLHPKMDLDTPVKVLALANGHRGMYDIPFRTHKSAGKPCGGAVYLWRKGKHVQVYRCDADGCGYEMTALSQDAPEKSETNNHSIMAQLATERAHWEQRAPTYCNLAWVTDRDYLAAVMEAGRLTDEDFVLDAGTGPGLIANWAAQTARDVIGMDLTSSMMELADTWQLNLEFVAGDIRAIPYPRYFFSKVFARMVLHGLTGENDLEKALYECYRVLRADGRLVVSEGVPTSSTIKDWYTETFQLKEDRLTVTAGMLQGLLEQTGFRHVEAVHHTIRQASVRNWLENSGLSPGKLTEIMQRYLTMPDYVRKGYKATTLKDDVLIDLKFAIVSGVK